MTDGIVQIREQTMNVKKKKRIWKRGIRKNARLLRRFLKSLGGAKCIIITNSAIGIVENGHKICRITEQQFDMILQNEENIRIEVFE